MKEKGSAKYLILKSTNLLVGEMWQILGLSATL